MERYGPSPVADWYENLHDAHCDAHCDASQCFVSVTVCVLLPSCTSGTYFPFILATAFVYTMMLIPSAPSLAFSFFVSIVIAEQ